MKTLILLTGVKGLGDRYDVVSVDDETALTLLSKRQALHEATAKDRFTGLLRYPTQK
jgi:hypothetical protein